MEQGNPWWREPIEWVRSGSQQWAILMTGGFPYGSDCQRRLKIPHFAD
jgi:hypothetical protein